jgi:hypothetical protein
VVAGDDGAGLLEAVDKLDAALEPDRFVQPIQSTR